MEYRLEELFDLQMGKTPSRNNGEYWRDEGKKWISISDLSQCGKYISMTKERISDKAVEETGIREIPADTVIMSFKLSIGKTAITSGPMYSNEAIMAFHDKHIAKLIPDYIYYMFSGKDWNEGTNKAVLGKTLNKATLSKVKVNICDIDKQRSIVDILDKVSDILESRKNELKMMDELIKARFVEMFGDPFMNEKGWPIATVADYYEVKGGKRIPKGMGYSSTPTMHPYLRATDMKNETILDNDIHYIDDEVFEKIKRYTVESGDIYLTNVGVNLGMAGVIPDKFDGANLTENAVKLVLKKEGLNSKYLAHYINTDGIQNYINERKMAVGVPKLAIFRIETMPLLIPDKKYQDAFVEFMECVDKSKAAVQKSLDETQVLFDSLMQKYFG